MNKVTQAVEKFTLISPSSFKEITLDYVDATNSLVHHLFLNFASFATQECPYLSSVYKKYFLDKTITLHEFVSEFNCLVKEKIKSSRDVLGDSVESNENRSQTFASKPLLKHILALAYYRAINEPKKLNKYKPFSAHVYGEISFDAMDQIIAKYEAKDHVRFLDLGSGVGQVVMQVAGSVQCDSCIGIEISSVPYDYSIKLSKEFKSIMEWFGKYYSPFEITQGDFTDPANTAIILKANFVFANNVMYGCELNNKLSAIFRDAPVGAQIFSSYPFAPKNFRLSLRTAGEFGAVARMNIMNLKMEHMVSWTPKSIPIYHHIVDDSALINLVSKAENPSLIEDFDVSSISNNRKLSRKRPKSYSFHINQLPKTRNPKLNKTLDDDHRDILVADLKASGIPHNSENIPPNPHAENTSSDEVAAINGSNEDITFTRRKREYLTKNIPDKNSINTESKSETQPVVNEEVLTSKNIPSKPPDPVKKPLNGVSGKLQIVSKKYSLANKGTSKTPLSKSKDLNGSKKIPRSDSSVPRASSIGLSVNKQPIDGENSLKASSKTVSAKLSDVPIALDPLKKMVHKSKKTQPYSNILPGKSHLSPCKKSLSRITQQLNILKSKDHNFKTTSRDAINESYSASNLKDIDMERPSNNTKRTVNPSTSSRTIPSKEWPANLVSMRSNSDSNILKIPISHRSVPTYKSTSFANSIIDSSGTQFKYGSGSITNMLLGSAQTKILSSMDITQRNIPINMSQLEDFMSKTIEHLDMAYATVILARNDVPNPQRKMFEHPRSCVFKMYRKLLDDLDLFREYSMNSFSKLLKTGYKSESFSTENDVD